MPRIIGVDYGRKRIGLATTDPLQIIVSPLDTVSRDEIIPYLKNYFASNPVEKVVVGEPLLEDGTKSDNHEEVSNFVLELQKNFPSIEIVLHDEYLTSAMAKEIIIKAVPSRKKRRDKSLVDKVSATLILQDYLNHI